MGAVNIENIKKERGNYSMKKLFGILILTLAIVLAVGATSFAAEKTIVDEFTDLSKVYSTVNAGLLTNTPWNDQRSVTAAVVKNGLELIYELPEATTKVIIDSYYMNTGGGVYADNLEFSVSANADTWNSIGDISPVITEGVANYNRAAKNYVFTVTDIPQNSNYIKISFPDDSAWGQRWFIVIDTVTITYEEVIKVPTYTFTDNLTDASEVELADASKADFGMTGDDGKAWGFVDGYGVIATKVGDRPELTYCMSDGIVGFELDTVLRQLATGVATDFIFKCSADGIVWETISASHVKGDKVDHESANIYKYVFSATNISADKNYKYLKITFGDNTMVESSNGTKYRNAVALDTVKVTCALGENTLTMADGESGTIYCSESTDSSKVTATIVAKDTASKSAIAILATYDSANKLVNVKTKDFSFNTTEDLSCERLILPAANSAKLMILDSLGALVPMTVVNPIQ